MATAKSDDGKAFAYKIKGATLSWAKLGEPVSPFGTLQNEIEISTTDKKVAKEWRDNHLLVKEKVEGIFTVGLKRKAQNADGTFKAKVPLVDAKQNTLPNDMIIGNGSVGNVNVYVYPYKNSTREGWSASLQAVQLLELKEYNAEAKPDFDDEEGYVKETEVVDFDF